MEALVSLRSERIPGSETHERAAERARLLSSQYRRRPHPVDARKGEPSSHTRVRDVPTAATS